MIGNFITYNVIGNITYSRVYIITANVGPWTKSHLVQGQFIKMPGTMKEHNISMQSLFRG